MDFDIVNITESSCCQIREHLSNDLQEGVSKEIDLHKILMSALCPKSEFLILDYSTFRDFGLLGLSIKH